MSALRERKKAVLRSTIRRSAVELFGQRGYDAVSMEDIAAAAMCSRSTLNRYFGAKEDVLFATALDATERLRDALEIAGTENRWNVARRTVTSHLRQVFDDMEPELRSDVLRLWYSEPSLRRRLLSIVWEWESILAHYFLVGLPDTRENRLQARVLSTTMASTLRASTQTAVESGQDIETLTDSAFAILEAGLPGPHRL
ncbi:TetR/AcrR family transcriptional regulator [Mycobacterium sp. NPDC003449]